MTHNTIDTPACNTKERGRCWGPNTWNNYTEENYEFLKNWLQNNCEDFVMQREIGTNGTPHIQFCMKFKNARRFSALKKEFEKVHFEKSKNFNATKNYCQKKDTAIDVCDKKKTRTVKDPLANKILYDWQLKLIELINTEPDDRTITWIYDENGNMGKTTLAKHLCLKYPNQALYISGKSADIKYGVTKFLENEKNELRICLFDFVRSNENYFSFEAIESIKNGIFYNTKYESTMVLYNPPHVICFSNFLPDLTKLSNDRWNIIDLSI